jgi:DNA repair protein RadC
VKQRFSVDSLFKVDVIPEELSAFLLTEQASGAVMVHNHPFGSAYPSEADDKMTINAQMLCSMHNLLLCDHIIYAPNGMYSYYLNGDLQNISQKYSSSSLFERQ